MKTHSPSQLRVIYLRGNSNLDARGLESAKAELSSSQKRRARWLANYHTIRNLAGVFATHSGPPNTQRTMYGIPLVEDERVPTKFVWLEVEEESPINLTNTININVNLPFQPGDTALLHDDLGRKPVTVVGHYTSNLWQVRLSSGKQFIISDHALQKYVPKWRPGDVVLVRFGGPFSTGYTYVRGFDKWPGETSPKTDAEMDRLFLEGKLKPLLQQGGKTFDTGRLRAA